MKDKQIRPVIAQLRKLGYDVVNTHNGAHLKVYRDGKLIAVISRNVASWRSMRNIRATLRRAGVTGLTSGEGN